jgi:transcriptional regulator with XRE-family HTH domain
MAKKTAPLLPSTDELLQRLGERLRMARQRRSLSAKQVAERAGMAPMTLRSLERGGSGVTIGAYLAVMQVLGMEKDINLLGQADPVGHELRDARLPAHRKTTARTRPAQAKSPVTKERGQPAPAEHAALSHRTADELLQEQTRTMLDSHTSERLPVDLDRLNVPSTGIKKAFEQTDNATKLFKQMETAQDWIKQSGFSSSKELADLLDSASLLSKMKGR